MVMPLGPGDPRRLGSYVLLARLGEGGMGTVFLGRSPGNRQVAIKTVRPEYADDPEYRGRFRSEVHRAQQVPPFSTAEVLDADPDHDPPYLVVEYVDGPSLAGVVAERGPLSGAALHSIAVGTAAALTAIHRAGVIHRDLKPDNVLLPRGGVKVIDFGIARPLEATSHHTATDDMVGTVAYMAPERFQEHPQVGFPADIFAWGVLVTYAATGRTPFHAESPPATAVRILTRPPELAGVPGPLRDLVARCLAKDPHERPAARDLLDELVLPGSDRAYLDGVDGSRAKAADAAPPPKERRGLRRFAVAGAAVALLGAAVPAVRALTAGGAGRTPDPAAAPDVLSGGRRAVIHFAELGEDMWVYPNGGEAETTGSVDAVGGESQFTLVPFGAGHQIRWLSEKYPGQCLGVHINPGTDAVLVTAPCHQTRATVFSIRPSGTRDRAGRPAYLLVNEAYGAVGLSGKDDRVIVAETAGHRRRTTFSFVDRGPA
ncbi:serine/threonine-protein kinase [Actinoplanes sp. NPDC051475]|uniref:serine/threonine-protein kinase n=1 Tax=Actinoplanes sp. NPDC051475 TaxID=3157225 RepID=UPI00344E2A15